MDQNAPIAEPNGPRLPAGQVPPANPPPPVGVAPPAPGAVQAPPAAPVKRSRIPRGPVPNASSSNMSSAPALLELSAAYPMYTEQRRVANFFLPDAQMLFHVLGICDQLMNSTDRFLRSSPAWIPIVSQLYISVLWNVCLLRVYVNSGYGAAFTNHLQQLIDHLQVGECMIPGPLIPFFQAISAVNGPFDWIGDITAGLPSIELIWDNVHFCAQSSVARQLPIPVLILDQLYYFARRELPANASFYSTFQWYRNVFSLPTNRQQRLHRIGPQHCGSLFTTQAQFDAARNFWNPAFEGFTRVDANQAEAYPLTSFLELHGFLSQTGEIQVNWFQHVAIVMQKYAQYFNGSAPLKSVLPTGIGAVVIHGKPEISQAVRDFIYPSDNMVEPFLTSRFNPRREIPPSLRIVFAHSDHEIEEQAEQYAILTHTNIDWSEVPAQHGLAQIDRAHNYQGDYWQMMPFRFSSPISLKAQFAQLIASRYHQQAANRAQ